MKVVEGIREEIIRLGGEIRFGQRVCDMRIEGEGKDRRLTALEVLDQDSGERQWLETDHAVMALGHSSRDTFAMFYERGVHMEAKPFSVGFRIEHPQSVIDRARWGRHAGHPLLGAADYKLVHHASNGRAVYSFCMCPGGTVVAATSEPERVVTNGMSQYSRAERNANAGMVCAIDPSDYPRDAKSFAWAFDGKTHGVENLKDGELHPLSGIVLQRQLETKAYLLGGRNYNAPGQLVGDFIAGKESAALGEVEPSYKPGITLTNLHHVLPAYAIEAMREALPAFGKKIRGYDMHDAVLTGVETRTSSPVKIERGADFHSLNTRGLYPAGEGASYAGGILSAGVDGVKVGEAVACAILGLPLPSSGHAAPVAQHDTASAPFRRPSRTPAAGRHCGHGRGGAVVQHPGAVRHQRLADLGRHHLSVRLPGERAGQPQLRPAAGPARGLGGLCRGRGRLAGAGAAAHRAGLGRSLHCLAVAGHRRVPPPACGPLVACPLVATLLAACLDTFLFWSIAFAGAAEPWVTWALGDLGVKLVLGVALLLPFRLAIARWWKSPSAIASAK